jgi:hypothetical protein
MVVQAPDGHPIRLQYQRHIEHPNGNWTWVGRPVGGGAGSEAILTFGQKAVFGTIPDGAGAPLEVTTSQGRTWMVQSDERRVSSAAPMAGDLLAAPSIAGAPQSPARRKPGSAATLASAESSATAQTTVDLVLGYTAHFAQRLGGQSQAVTRLNFMVDVANQAYFNSEIGGQLRLVNTVQVAYPDATVNRTALFELSGVTCTVTSGTAPMYLPDAGANCTNAAVPAALQPVLAAKAQYGADLAGLVRTFESPEQQSCGVAWLLGGGRAAIGPANAKFGLAVISDSSGTTFSDPDNGASCRNETLAHELGHNMGLAHDVETAQGNDDTNSDGNALDPEEYGAYADAFGYKADSFFTVMAVPSLGQSGVRMFSNPRKTTCGSTNNLPCGVVGQSDNARVLSQTMPIVAGFSVPRVPISGVWRRGDYNGDHKSDVLWHNTSTSANSIWRSANLATPQAVATVTDRAWIIMGGGDFDGDGRSDILWRNIRTGANSYWKGGNIATVQVVGAIADQSWQPVAVGDFNADNKDDIVWRNIVTGSNSIWRSADAAQSQPLARVADVAWTVVGAGDFDGDGRDDILWRNTRTGANSYWKSGSASTVQTLTTVADQSWVVVGVGDFDGDHRADILWRNSRTGANSIWKSGNSATVQATAAVASQAWMIVGIGDFDGDGKDDIEWRNSVTGQNSIWKSGNVSTIQAMTSVASQAWVVAG